MWTLFFTQLLLGIFSMLIIFVIGKLLIGFYDFKGDFFLKLFIIYIIGIISIVFFYSIIKAHGRTINFALLPIFITIIYLFRKNTISFQKINLKIIKVEILWSIIIFLTFFLFQSQFYFDFHKGEIKPLFIDIYRYSANIDSLRLWGIETGPNDVNYFIPKYRTGLIPYHFAELWLSAFFGNLFQINSVASYHIVVLIVLVSVYVLGIMSLFEKYINNKIILYLTSISLLFISGINILGINANNIWGILEIAGQKLSFVYCILLLSFILIKNNHWKIGLIILASIPIFSITFLPGIIGGICLYLILFILINKIKNIKHQIFILCTVLTVFLLIMLMYYLNPTVNSTSKEVSNTITLGIFKGIHGNLFLKCKIIISNFIHYAIPTIGIHFGVISSLFLLYFIVLSPIIVSKFRLFALLVFCIIIIGATSATIFRELMDSNQFIEALSAIYVVFIIIILSDLIKYIQKWTTVNYIFCIMLSVSLIYISIIQIYRNKTAMTFSESTEFLEKSNEMLNGKIPIIMSFQSLIEIPLMPRYNMLIIKNNIIQLSQYSQYPIIFTLGNPNVLLQVSQFRAFDDHAYKNWIPFNIWKKTHPQKNLKDFIETFKIKYFYFEAKMEIPSFIKKNVIKTVISPKTHSTFIQIK